MSAHQAASAGMVIVETGAAMTRAVRLQGEMPTALAFGPSPDDMSGAPPSPGDVYIGRVERVDHGLAAAFVDLSGPTGFLPVKHSDRALVCEGALVNVKVLAPARQDKGALLRLNRDGVLDPPGRQETVHPAVRAAAQIAQEGDRVIVSTPIAKAALAKAGMTSVIDASGALFDRTGGVAATQGAFSRTLPLVGGGRLHIDESEAMVSIDVDTGSLAAPSTAALRRKVASSAISEAARQITLRNFAGRIVIDLPAPKGASALADWRRLAADAFSAIPGVSGISVAPNGLTTCVRQRNGLSLLEFATEPAPADPVPGRCFTAFWRAAWAISSLEDRLAKTPGRSLRLEIGADINALMKTRAWEDSLREKAPARIAIEHQPALGPRDYVIHETQ